MRNAVVNLCLAFAALLVVGAGATSGTVGFSDVAQDFHTHGNGWGNGAPIVG